jgi:hypothetical protein
MVITLQPASATIHDMRSWEAFSKIIGRLPYFAYVLFLTGTFLFTRPSFAYYPFFTNDTGTQGQGGQQLEASYEWVYSQSDAVDEEGRVLGSVSGAVSNLPLTYTVGLTDRIDFSVGLARQLTPTGGWQNTELGLEWAFWGDQDAGWSFSINPVLLLPVTTAMQSNGLGNARLNALATVIASYMHPDYELHINAGYQSNRYANTDFLNPQRVNLWSVSVAPVLVLNEQWKIGVDIGIQTNPTYDSQYQMSIGLGILYLPTKNLAIGLGAYAAPSLKEQTRQQSYTITTGVTIKF